VKKSEEERSFLLETLEATVNRGNGARLFGATVISLGVIWHRDVSKIGAISRLKFDQSGCVALSRLTPIFSPLEEGEDSPLMDRGISRTPLKIKRLNARQFEFTPPDKPIGLHINGQKIEKATTFSLNDLGDEIIISLSNSVVLALFNAPARSAPRDQFTKDGLIGISNAIAMVRHAITQIAETDIPVLIRGETGTGKELVARALHAQSHRSAQEIISVNMAAMPSSLANAELFGVKRGAFTGASADRAGMFEQAHNKTLFLDEIGDTPDQVQPMLLRALENGEVRRVGDEKLRSVNVRLISATDRSLEAEEGQFSFNQPLLQRLCGFTIEIPPLRSRLVDIGVLAKHFMHNGDIKIQNSDISAFAIDNMAQLCAYSWPGNIRELRNALQNIGLGQPFKRQPDNVQTIKTDEASVSQIEGTVKTYRHPGEVGQNELLKALDDTGWVIKAAAQKLGISRTALYGLMAKSENIANLSDISDEVLRETITTVPGGIDAWVKHLRVGKDALAKRLKDF